MAQEPPFVVSARYRRRFLKPPVGSSRSGETPRGPINSGPTELGVSRPSPWGPPGLAREFSLFSSPFMGGTPMGRMAGTAMPPEEPLFNGLLGGETALLRFPCPQRPRAFRGRVEGLSTFSSLPVGVCSRLDERGCRPRNHGTRRCRAFHLDRNLKTRAANRSSFLGCIWHSHNVSARHPSRRSARRFRASRALFPISLGRQNPSRDFGILLPSLQGC